ncbi:hypothetical protein [Endozoicomonas sp.]|uniref:hypothetical protein n=1 Tax=Endozoicomonas sp. TaxID=1892382 RepID=UPI002886651E|nr:hypothetical protein [Endozoicomonas sp.]
MSSPNPACQPTEFYEIEGVIRAITHEGITRHGDPFIKMKFKTNTGEIYTLSKFKSTTDDIERLIGKQVRIDYQCTTDSEDKEYKNIDGDIEILPDNAPQPVQQAYQQQAPQQPYQQQQPQTQAVYQQQPQQQPQQAHFQPQQQVPQQPVYQQPIQQQSSQQPQNEPQPQPLNGFDDDGVPDIPF